MSRTTQFLSRAAKTLIATCAALPLAAQAAPPPRCTTGTYQAETGGALLPNGDARVSLRDGAIHLEGCSAIRAKISTKKKKVVIKASWKAAQCPAIGKVKLAAETDLACTSMKGKVTAKKWKRRFVAPAASPIPAPTVVVDTALVPEVAQLRGIGDEPPRPVAALTDHTGKLLHFVENELVVASHDADSVAALAARVGGTVVHQIDDGVELGLPVYYLVRIEQSSVDLSGLERDLQALSPDASGNLRLSSDAGLATLAAAAREAVAGAHIGLDIVFQPNGYVERTTTESPSLGVCPPPPTAGAPRPTANCVPALLGGSEGFDVDAFKWSYMGTGAGTQNIGVGEAWRTLHLAGKLGAPRFRIAFLDGGFAPSSDHPRPWTHVAANPDDPYQENQQTCTNDSPCPWHGTNVVSAAMGVPHDGIGAAGPAGAVAVPLTLEMTGDTFRYVQNWIDIVHSDARIVSMSFSAPVAAIVGWAMSVVDLPVAMARSQGKLILASAGNNNRDVDAEDCAPPFDWPCWEETWVSPCENAGVTCIGALNDRMAIRRPTSNFGAEDVDLFGPGNLWVGEDRGDPEPHLYGGTSAATPFVAGVAALVMAANPDLTGPAVEEILIQSARPSPDASVRRYVDANAAVLLALTGSSTCLTPEITRQPPSRISAACVDQTFSVEVGNNGAVGPFTYQWRRHTGNNVWVPVVDGARISGSQTESLAIGDLRPEDVGTYDVLVSNLCGTTESAPAAVNMVSGAVGQAPSLPVERQGFAMAYDRARGRTVLHGGMRRAYVSGVVSTEYSDQTWERGDDGVWQYVTNSGPSPRMGHAMAYDEARGVTVLFGGFTCWGFCDFQDSQVFAETWEWDGSTWTRRDVAGPEGRWTHSMAYDPSRQRVVLYGGRPRNGMPWAYSDLWEWDGEHWVQRGAEGDPTPGPSGAPLGFPHARSGAGLAFDRARNALVLHGGRYSITSPNMRWGETWELDSLYRWRLRAVAQPGTALAFDGDSLMAFDLDAEKTLLYKPAYGSSPAGFWEWTGSGWERLGPAPSTVGARVVYDEARNRTSLVGGAPVFDSTGEVWEWRFLDGLMCTPLED